MNREKELLWGILDELYDLVMAGVAKFNQVSVERDQAQREADSLRQENQVLWGEVVAQQQLALAQQQLIESQQRLVESQQKLIMEMRRVRSARARYEVQRTAPEK